MYYELYIDIFFLVNFMLDFLVLVLVKKWLHYSASIFKLLIAAGLGSAGLCIFVLLPFRHLFLVQLLFHIGIYTAMIMISFQPSNIRSFMKSFLALYGISFLLSGIYSELAEKIKGLSKLCFFSMLVFIVVRFSMELFTRISSEKNNLCSVDICYQGSRITMSGLWDTGNRLTSPFHQKGVSVIGYTDLEPYLQEKTKGKIKFYLENQHEDEVLPLSYEEYEEPVILIPYHSIGKQHGMLPVISAEKLYIQKDGEVLEYNRPLLGISKDNVTKNGTYQVILTTRG